LLIDAEARLNSYVKEIPEQAWQLIEYADKPLTIIYENARNLPQEIISSDGTVAIRITKDDFCKDLIRALKKPMISTSANVSGASSPSSFRDVDERIVSGVDYVVKWRQSENITVKPSTIVSIKQGGQI